MRSTFLALTLIGAAFSIGADWSHFRGSDGSSFSAQTDLPAGENIGESIVWKKDLPGRAVSGPIIVGNKVFVTASGGPKDEQLFVLAYDADTGEELWRRQFWATGRTLHHPTSATAAPTPASDGESIFAFYSSNDLICLDLDGNLRWLRGLTVDFPAAYNDTGMASSPLVIGDTVIVQVESFGDSFAAGIDKRTGETRWRIPRKTNSNWCSPVLWHSPQGDVALLQSSDRLSAIEPLTGKEIWAYEADCSTIPSPTVAGKTIYLASGGVTALEPKGNDAPSALWKGNRLGPDSASPIVVNDSIYVINGAGVLVCGDVKDGKVKWQTRLSGTYWATPVVAGSHLYAVNQDGLLQVVKLPDGEGKGEVVAKHELGEGAFGSPAIGDGAIYIQSEKSLFKFGKR